MPLKEIMILLSTISNKLIKYHTSIVINLLVWDLTAWDGL